MTKCGIFILSIFIHTFLSLLLGCIITLLSFPKQNRENKKKLKWIFK